MYEGKNLENMSIDELYKLRKKVETGLILVQKQKEYNKLASDSKE